MPNFGRIQPGVRLALPFSLYGRRIGDCLPQLCGGQSLFVRKKAVRAVLLCFRRFTRTDKRNTDIDPVEQGRRKTPPILFDRLRPAQANFIRTAEVAAGAGICRQKQLKAGRVVGAAPRPA